MPSKSENFWCRFFFLRCRIFSLDWPEKFCQEFSTLNYVRWSRSSSCLSLACPPGCAWRMQQVDLPSTCYINCWPTKNATGWPPLYLLHQVIDLPRMQQVDLPSTFYIKWLTYRECSRLTSPLPICYIKWLTHQEGSRLSSPLPVTSSDWQQVDSFLSVTSSDWPTKNAAGWPPIYPLHQVLTYQECSRLTYPVPVISNGWLTKSASGWPPLYL